MELKTVAENLRNTIKGKEMLLASFVNSGEVGYEVIKHMLTMNIDELNRILTDVEACMNKDTENGS
jgi:hypothetical protein